MLLLQAVLPQRVPTNMMGALQNIVMSRMCVHVLRGNKIFDVFFMTLITRHYDYLSCITFKSTISISYSIERNEI